MSRRRPGSRHYAALDRRRWAAARRAALRRSGYRSELSGHAGKLEVDHIVPLHRGGDPYDLANLQVLTRAEHIRKTAAENRKPDPARDAWRKLVSELAPTTKRATVTS